jgi:hypothetical protein
MDPYLEDPAYWLDFHARFTTYWCDAVADLLPPNYEARLEEQFRLVERTSEETRRGRPDVGILQRSPSGSAPAPAGGTLTLEPVTVPHVVLEEMRDVRIQLLHNPGRTLVAVLELLSPSTKRDPDRGEYLDKRYGLLRRKVHLVELDLLVGGHRLPMREPLPPGDYYALVSRAERYPDCQVYAWTVRQPLPEIRIPLRAPDPDVVLPLGPVFATAYERGRYARSIDYATPPRAPLPPQDREWATALAGQAPRAG